MRLGWRKEEGGLHVSKAVDACIRLDILRRQISGRIFVNAVDLQICGSRSGLRDDRSDPANDQVPVLADADGDDRLDVENILRAVIGANAEVGVVLKRDADQAGDGILRGFL